MQRHLAVWAVVLVPIVCAIAIGARLGLYAAPFASALVVLLGSVTGGVFVLRLSWRLSRLDAKRSEAQGQLRQAHERIELALRGADLAAWDWNIESGEVIYNPRWAEMRGYRPGEIAPSVDSWTSGIHPEDLPRVKQALDDYFEGRAPEYQTEHRVRTRSGEWIWILDRGKVFARDDRGRPIRMVGTELDVTPRKRLEDESAFLAEIGSILASTLEFEATLTSIGEAVTRALVDVCIVYIVDDDGEVRRVKAVARSPSQEWICEVLMQRPIARRAHAIWSELEAHRSVLLERVSPELIASLAQDEVHLRALRAMDPRSSVVVPLLARGKLVGAMVFVSLAPSRAYAPADVRFAERIGERAALAIENARLYAEARRAIKARDDVLGVVAHDLRNPLGSILLQAELLRHPGAEASRKPAEMIERSARRMNRLIQDLLDVARMDGGRLSVELSRVAAADLVGDTVDGQRALAKAASLELRAEVARGVPEVWADRDRVQQVLENLIGNAVKFTGPGGTISVGAAPRQDEVLFWVTDTGAGIAGEDLPHVFDRFWQAGRNGRRGAGLGLAIAKGIVEAHGGRIWVESTPGRGSTFFFTLARVPRAEEQPALHAP
jgi:PAS domain S-box-containing protein